MQAVLTVSAINNYLKNIVETDFVLNNLLVQGEISNFKEYKVGGQWYFTLKDETAQLNCVVFENFVHRMKFKPKDGDKIILKGKLSVFAKRGTYSLQVFWLEHTGLGALAKAFDELKEKLSKEGLFAQEHKRALPRFPRKIAVLAALEGAAVHDVINVARRRDNSIEVLIIPTIVQGGQAVDSIVRSIELADSRKDIEVLILARGGGSLEDLWSFNEEKVVRAIYNCRVPVVSAIGHEIDFTIADMVADLRAATPSVAAELVVPDRGQYLERVRQIQDYLLQNLNKIIVDQYQNIDYFQERLNELFRWKLEKLQNSFKQLSGRLEDLNPLAVLQRGYSIIEKKGQVVSSLKKIRKNDIIKILFKDGFAGARILNKGAGQKNG